MLFAIAVFAVALPAHANRIDDNAFKLMSFNIRYYKPGADGDNCWENRREAVLKVIREENPDIIGFQEPHRPQVDFLKINLSDYASLDMGRDADTDIKKRPDGGEHLMLM